MTHVELVKRGMRWLINTKRCSVAVSELVAGAEVADVIGWLGDFSYLIEAKASLSDFKADQHKLPRKYPEHGLGRFRYYIVPLELKDKVLNLLPPHWGLLAAGAKAVFVVRDIDPVIDRFEHNHGREMDILLSIIRRIYDPLHPLVGVGVRWYMGFPEAQEPRAELYVEPLAEVA